MLQAKFRDKEKAFNDMGELLAKTNEKLARLEEKEKEEKGKVRVIDVM